MGSIVGAAVVSHVPPLVLPEATRRHLNDGEDTSLFQGLHDLRAEKLAPLGADTVVVIDTETQEVVGVIEVGPNATGVGIRSVP